MSLSVEVLLRPRFELIASYPGCTDKVGAITTEVATADYFRQYKANFRELHWSAERRSDDLPDYVKDAEGNVYNVWFSSIDTSTWVMHIYGKKIPYSPIGFEPATLEQYNEFINSKKP